jgi:hypothetical protein
VDEQHRHRQQRCCEKRPSFTRAAWLTRRAREITGCPRETGPGFGLPGETRQNAGSIVGMPACGTHPRRGCAARLCESRPAAWRGAGDGASCPSRAPAGLLCPSPQYPALGRDPRIPARSSAAGAAEGRSNHHLSHVRHPSDPGGTDRDAGVAVEVSQKVHERAMHEGEGLRLEDGIWLAGSRARTCPGQHTSWQARLSRLGLRGSPGGHGEVINWHTAAHSLASGGLTVVRARWNVGCGTAGDPALQGRPELPTVRGTT